MKALIVVLALGATSPARIEAQPPAYATELAGAGLFWLGRLDDVSVSNVVDFADVVASQTDYATGLLVMSIAAFESRFHPEVMRAIVRGDDGAACGALQIHIDVQKRPRDRTCAEEAADPVSYVRLALRWLVTTPSAWGNVSMHRERVRRWLAR